MALECDNNRVGWEYTSDDGNTYGVSAKAKYVAQGGEGTETVGGQARGATDLRIPKDIRMRFVYFVDTATKAIRRRVVCYDTTCAAWTTPGTTMQLCINGAPVACEATNARRAEYRRETTSQVA